MDKIGYTIINYYYTLHIQDYIQHNYIILEDLQN